MLRVHAARNGWYFRYGLRFIDVRRLVAHEAFCFWSRWLFFGEGASFFSASPKKIYQGLSAAHPHLSASR